MTIAQISDGEVGSSVRAKLNASINYTNGLIEQDTVLKTITAKSDLPTPVSGVITLPANTSYLFIGDIDLTGDRLVCAGVVCILGTSSETSSITSTGLTGAPLITSIYTLPVRHITIKNVDTGILAGGGAGNAALDWFGVNFLNCDLGLDITDIDNFVFNTGAFLGGSRVRLRGTFGSAVFNNSIFISDGTAQASLEVTSTAVVQRRVRLTTCVFVTTSLSNSINFSELATVPTEGYILSTLNFSGGGTYLVGLDQTSNKALFKNNVGIPNTADISQYYMNGNTTTTTIATQGVAVKVEGVTTDSPATSKFTHTNNRTTYVGALTQFFRVTATTSLDSGNNNRIGVYIAKNGVVIPESEVYGTTSGTGRSENIVCQSLVQLTLNDFIEVWVENDTGTQNITVSDLNVIVTD